jgi:hypothetical protein
METGTVISNKAAFPGSNHPIPNTPIVSMLFGRGQCPCEESLTVLEHESDVKPKDHRRQTKTDGQCKQFEIVSRNRRRTNGRSRALRVEDDQSADVTERLIFETMVGEYSELFPLVTSPRDPWHGWLIDPEFQKPFGFRSVNDGCDHLFSLKQDRNGMLVFQTSNRQIYMLMYASAF